MIFVGCLCAAFVRFSESIPLLEHIQSISVINWHLLTSYFGGHSVTCQNCSAGNCRIVPLNCRKCCIDFCKCRKLVTSVANDVQTYCHVDDTKEALITSHMTDLKEEN